MLNRCRRVLPDIVNPVWGEARNYRSFREYPVTRSTGTLELLIVEFGIVEWKCPTKSKRRNQNWLVSEVPHSGEDHGQSEAVGSLDDFLIADRAAGLNNRRGTGFGNFLDSIRKGEEGVGGGHRAVKREHSLHRPDTAGIDTAHLAGANADALPIASVKDRVRLDVLADFPGE